MRRPTLLLVLATLAACQTTTTQGVISEVPPSDTLLRYEILEPYETTPQTERELHRETGHEDALGALDGDVHFEYGAVPLELTHLGDRIRWTTGDGSVLRVDDTAFTLRWVDIQRSANGLSLTFVHQDAEGQELSVSARVESDAASTEFGPVASHAPSSAEDRVSLEGSAIDLAAGLPEPTDCVRGDEHGTLVLTRPIFMTAEQIAALTAAL